MKFYHGSPNAYLSSLKRMQAEASESVEVPEDELKYGNIFNATLRVCIGNGC